MIDTPRRLAGVSFGRIVFTQNALPAIRPINHIVDTDAIIVRTHLGAALLSATGIVVAYEADDIDPREQVGWSAVVTGVASRVRNRDEVSRYQRLLQPWVDGERNEIIRIQPDLVTGYQLTVDSSDHCPPRPLATKRGP